MLSNGIKVLELGTWVVYIQPVACIIVYWKGGAVIIMGGTKVHSTSNYSLNSNC